MNSITHKGTNFYLNGVNFSIMEFYEKGLIDSLIAYIEQMVLKHKELKRYLELVQDKGRLEVFKELLDA